MLILQWLLADDGAARVALIAGVALLAGLARGFSGFGAALIFVPLGSMLVGPKQAASVLAIVDIIFAAHLIPTALRQADVREVGLMLLGALVGLPLGAAVLSSFEPLTLRWLISALALAMLLLLLSGWRYKGRPHASSTVAVGGISGLFSGIAQIGGPPVVSYWMGTDTPPHRLRANVIVYFAASSVLTIAVYALRHIFDGNSLRLALLCGPAYGLGTWVGGHVFGLATPATFRAITLMLIAAAVLLSLPVQWW